MNQPEIEYWALQIIAAVTGGNRVEDSRVELKVDWPDPVRAARRLAGHANAARGDNVLWLIGVDEQRGVVGVNPPDLANWWSGTMKHFQGPVPVTTPVTVYHENKPTVAIFVETESSPFVVKNPAFGSPSGGPVELEVPWREMTAVRTARHEDLIRLLVPKLRMPMIEVLEAKLTGGTMSASGDLVASVEGPPPSWFASFLIYVVPHSAETAVFPAHHISVTMGMTEFPPQELEYYGIRSSSTGNLMDSAADLIAAGPSRLSFESSAKNSGAALPTTPPTLEIQLRSAGNAEKLLIRCEMVQRVDNVWDLKTATTTLVPWS